MASKTVIIDEMDRDDLHQFIQAIFREEIKKVLTQPAAPKYKTRKQTCSELHISLPTLDEYLKQGVIIGHRFGRRILFEESDIQLAVKQIPSLLYSRKGKR